MRASFRQIVKEAFETDCASFTVLVNETARTLSKENGKIGSLHVTGRLVEVQPEGKALVIGDLHGDLESLADIFQKSRFLQKMNRDKGAFLIFLGDYGDRGACSAEVYYTILKLKLALPEQVVLVRGNHEGPDDLKPSPHDLPAQFQKRFGKEWNEAYTTIHKLFPYLYSAVLVKERYIMIHGGLPTDAKSIADIAFAHATHPRTTYLEEMLWSDPNDSSLETCASPRGAGKLFGQDVTERWLEKLGVKVLIRGHESCQEGFKFDHSCKILTLFSRKGPPYFNAHGAYIEIDLAEKLGNTEQLVQHIRRF